MNDYPLTDSEMQQILEQIETLRTPLKLNGFINGRSVSIVRDNPDDKLHFGKEISLKIYDRREIAAGQSRYQIVQQPKFPTKSKSLRDYINEYLYKARNDQIHRIAIALGINEDLLRNIMSLKLNENNLNEFGRYDELKKTVDKAVAKNYFEKIEGTKIIPPKVNVKVDKLLRDFIINGGYEIPIPTDDE